MRIRWIAPIMAAAALAGCDAATQIAGDAVQGEIRSVVATQCRQVSESAGIAAGRVSEVCECAADTYAKDPDLTLDDITRERVEGIVNDCTARTGTATGASGSFGETTPTEEIGG
jgi:hypothetical protein